MSARRALFLLLLVAVGCGEAAENADGNAAAPDRIEYGEPRLLCRLADRAIDESSGLAQGRRNPDVFWTHNDSGAGPVLYGVNQKGATVATVRLNLPAVEDCEDIAAFSEGGKDYVLLADTGDNARRRDAYTLYIIEEPTLAPGKTPVVLKADVARTLRFRFDKGPEDGEGVAVHVQSKTVYLATRNQFRKECHIYALPLPDQTPKQVLEAKRLVTWPIRYANALDLSPDGLRAILGTYTSAYEFTRKPDETWADAFKRKPRVLPMPLRRKGEAICYGADGVTLYLTSEGRTPPLWQVPVKK